MWIFEIKEEMVKWFVVFMRLVIKVVVVEVYVEVGMCYYY